MEECKEPNVHQGRNLKRIRESLGLKQDYVAKMLFGDEASQSRIARIEKQRAIKPDILEQFALYYKVDVSVIKNMEEDPVRILIKNNTFESGSQLSVNEGDGIMNGNPIEEILKLSREKEVLYEKLIKNEQARFKQLKKHFYMLEERLKRLEEKLK